LDGYAYIIRGGLELAGFLMAQEVMVTPSAATIPVPTLVVAFRTHTWNSYIAEMARRLAAVVDGAHFIILVDETLAPSDTTPFEKLAHTDNFSAFGLPNFPSGSVLWYNADYPLYCLRQRFPTATHYAMVEFDVAVNIDLAALMRHVHDSKIDLLAHNIREPLPDWAWTKTAAAHFRRPLQAFFPLLIVSYRAIDHLYKCRLHILRNGDPAREEDWPFCEAFIPSAVAEIPGANIQPLAAHADLASYRDVFPLHLNQPDATRPGTISHPVLGGPAFAERWLKYVNPEEIFAPHSTLRQQLAFCAPEEFVASLLRRLRAQPAPPPEEQIASLAVELAWPAALLAPNRALNRPATQSSVCKWSKHPTREADASGANNGQITGLPGFHTAFERDPWWQVDLGADFAIERAVIYNRMDHRARCTRLSISGSSDGQTWTLRAAKLDSALFGGLDGRPHIFRFYPAFTARFIRLTMIGEDFFHLDEVEIYGELLH
jgi:hypothetical protein